MAYCELTGAVRDHDGETLKPGSQLKVFKVLSAVGTIIGNSITTHTLLASGAWSSPLRFERGSVAYLYLNAPGFDRDSQHGTPVQIPDADTAELVALAAPVAIPSQVPVAIPPALTGGFLELEN